MDLYQATFPLVKNLYLYRDAGGFVASFARIFRQAHLPESLPVGEYLALLGPTIDEDLTAYAVYLSADTTVLTIPQVLTLAWLALTDRYLAQHARGIPILAVRYDDLNAHRAQVVTAILEHCGLAATQAARLLGVFARDAQAGSLLARENPDQGNQRQLTGEEVAEMTRIVQRHPVITTADFVAPGTLPMSAD